VIMRKNAPRVQIEGVLRIGHLRGRHVSGNHEPPGAAGEPPVVEKPGPGMGPVGTGPLQAGLTYPRKMYHI